MKSNKEISTKFARDKAATVRGLSNQWRNSEACDAFDAGDSMDIRGEIEGFRTNRKVQVQFSKVKPYIDSVNGFMIQNRRDARYAARIEDNQEAQTYSKNANAIDSYIRGNANADQIESQQNRSMLVKGYGATETAMTYDMGYSTRDPNGEIVLGDVTDTVGWDPMARRTNLLDARWVYYRKSYSLEDAKKLFQDSDDESFESDPGADNDTGYKYDPWIGPKYDRSKVDYDLSDMYEWDNETDQTVFVYFYQWVEIEDFYKSVNPLTTIDDPMLVNLAMMKMRAIADESEQADDMFKFNPTAEEITFNSRIKTQLEKEFEGMFKAYKYQRQVYYTAVVSGKKVFKSYRNQSQQGFTVKFKTGGWDNRNKIWVGMVNGMMEPVKFFNKSLTEFLYIIAATAKGGYFVEEDAVEDIAAFERKANKTDSVVMVANGALQKGAIQPKKQGVNVSATGLDTILSISDKSIGDANGIDPSFLGSSENKLQTAQLQRQIVRQVTSILASYFDACILYQKEWARMALDLYKVWAENNTGALIRIAGEEEATTFLRVSKDLFAAEYDVDIIEAPQTPEEKLEMAQIISNTGDIYVQTNPQLAGQIKAISFKYLPIAAEDKQKLTQMLSPQGPSPEVQQLQQQVQQLMSEQNKVQIAGLISQTNLNDAKTVQTIEDAKKKAQEAKRTAIETQLVPLTELSNISINI